MKNFNRIGILLVCAAVMQSCGDNQRAKNFNNKTLVDQQGLAFIKKANDAGLTEIKAAMFAETMSKTPRVIGFAKMMVTDHTQAGKELSTLAADKLVDKADSISVEHQKSLDSLARLSANVFDHAYMKMMVQDHEQAVQLFTDAGQNKSSAVQKFARKTLPALQMHLDSAKAIYSSLK